MAKRGKTVRRPVREHKSSTARKRAPAEVAAKKENSRLKHELAEAREQQAATSELLKVIGRSTLDLQPVFETLAENAVRLCEAERSFIFRFDGQCLRVVATHNASAEIRAFVERNPIAPGRGSATARAALERRTVHVLDAQTDPEYTYGSRQVDPFRTILTVPILKADELLGVILIYRHEVRSFTDSQIALLESFADQAVIAIENVRLFDEVQARTRDLSEALEQQTATSEVLEIISASTGELEPVFQKMLENATRVCGATFGSMTLYDGDSFRHVARHNMPAAFADATFRPHPKSGMATVMRTRQAVQIEDLRTQPPYLEGDPAVVALSDLAGARTLVIVPMLRENELIGVMSIFRQEVRPFTGKQVELVANFAKQAVIAIENTRLFSELQAKTRELAARNSAYSEQIDHQSATIEILKAMSASQGDAQPVFDVIVRRALQICNTDVVVLLEFDGKLVHLRSIHVDETSTSPQTIESYKGIFPQPPSRASVALRAILYGQIIHIPDMAEDSDLSQASRDIGRKGGVAIPLMRDGMVIGSIGLAAKVIGGFSDAQIELLKTFAEQAVIAIRSAETFRELNTRTRDLSESLHQQTATADVLKAISRSAFDLKTVLDALVEAAARLCKADQGNIARERDGVYQRVATYGFSDDYTEYLTTQPVIPQRGTAMGRALLEGKVVHIPDVRADPEYTFVEAQRRGGFRTVLGVPMLREGAPIGVLALARREVRPFTDKQIALVTIFADQAAIAIENVRLFESVEARTRELAASLEDLRTAQDRLVQTEKLASLGQLTAGIAHEIKNPLNFVNNFSAVSVELIDEMQETLEGVQLDEDKRTELNQLAETLRGNLDKVLQHGKRADAIVKNMLLHSREGSGEHRPVDVNALVEESLNLAYHGARAEKQGFNVTLKRSFDPNAGEVDMFPQEITRVLLNLISNGFYAATKRKGQADSDGYKPTLAAATRDLGDRVEIRIRDNGSGIAPEVKEKMFNPFFTTKPPGEGTGLGLSLSYDIIVKQHAGSIEVDTRPGGFTEFRVILPRAATTSKTGANR